jgi:hypothetical protein
MSEQNIRAASSLSAFQAFNDPLFKAVELLAVKGARFATSEMQINFVVGRQAEPVRNSFQSPRSRLNAMRFALG